MNKLIIPNSIIKLPAYIERVMWLEKRTSDRSEFLQTLSTFTRQLFHKFIFNSIYFYLIAGNICVHIKHLKIVIAVVDMNRLFIGHKYVPTNCSIADFVVGYMCDIVLDFHSVLIHFHRICYIYMYGVLIQSRFRTELTCSTMLKRLQGLFPLYLPLSTHIPAIWQRYKPRHSI